MVEVIGIAIAFITTILIFSILVTALVQALNKVMQLKHKDLKFGMGKFAEAIQAKQSGFPVASFTEQVTTGIVIKKAEYVDFEKAETTYQDLSESNTQIEPEVLKQMFQQTIHVFHCKFYYFSKNHG